MGTNMRVYIITEGGKEIGFGHIARCSALYDAFLEKGIEPLFIINGDESVRGLLKGRDYIIFDWLSERQKLFDIIRYADVGIIDSYLAPLNLYERIEKIVKVPVYIDDNKRLEYPRGVVLNGNIYAEGMAYPEKREMVYLLGTKYTPLRKEFWFFPEKKVKEKLEKVMITFGGDDKRRLTSNILKLLVKSFPDVTKVVIIGKGFKDMDFYEGYGVTLIWHPDGIKMRDIMLDVDIAVSAGGQTIYELARTGTPPVVVGVAENQRNNIIAWKDRGFIRYAGWWDDKYLYENVILGVKALIPYETRKKLADFGRSLIDGKGALRVVDTVFSLI